MTIQKRLDTGGWKTEDRWLKGGEKKPGTGELASGPGSTLMHCLALGGPLPFASKEKLILGTLESLPFPKSEALNPVMMQTCLLLGKGNRVR